MAIARTAGSRGARETEEERGRDGRRKEGAERENGRERKILGEIVAAAAAAAASGMTSATIKAFKDGGRLRTAAIEANAVGEGEEPERVEREKLKQKNEAQNDGDGIPA